MKAMLAVVTLVMTMSITTRSQTGGHSSGQAILLEDLTWIQAETILNPETVVVIPLDAAAKEHGPHLKLKNDFLIAEQEGGTHADEIETSIMLYISPANVNMKKAVKDYHPSKGRGLTRDPKGEGTYSATGIWGDPTLATREKGRTLTEFLVAGILREISDLQQAPLPAGTKPLR